MPLLGGLAAFAHHTVPSAGCGVFCTQFAACAAMAGAPSLVQDHPARLETRRRAATASQGRCAPLHLDGAGNLHGMGNPPRTRTVALVAPGHRCGGDVVCGATSCQADASDRSDLQGLTQPPPRDRFRFPNPSLTAEGGKEFVPRHFPPQTRRKTHCLPVDLSIY